MLPILGFFNTHKQGWSLNFDGSGRWVRRKRKKTRGEKGNEKNFFERQRDKSKGERRKGCEKVS